MDEKQFRELRTLILDLRMDISSLKLAIKARQELEDARFRMIFEALYENPEDEGHKGETYTSDELMELLANRASASAPKS